MSYEVPEITDLGQISKHVFVNFSPNGLNEDPTAAGSGEEGSGGLAALGVIGGIVAALAGRSSDLEQVHASGTPEDEERVNER